MEQSRSLVEDRKSTGTFLTLFRLAKKEGLRTAIEIAKSCLRKGPDFYELDPDRNALTFKAIVRSDEERQRNTWNVRQKLGEDAGRQQRGDSAPALTPPAGSPASLPAAVPTQVPPPQEDAALPQVAAADPTCAAATPGGDAQGNGLQDNDAQGSGEDLLGGKRLAPSHPGSNVGGDDDPPNKNKMPRLGVKPGKPGKPGNVVDAKKFKKAEQDCLRTISCYRLSVSTAKSIIEAVACDKDWEWLRLPNKLMQELHSLVASVEQCTTPFFRRVLVSDQVRSTAKTELHYNNMIEVCASLDKPLEKLNAHTKRLTGMHASLMSAD